MSITKFADFISTRGILPENTIEKFFILWLNRTCFVTALGAFLLFISTFFLEINENIAFYRFLTLLVTVFYTLVIVLHHFNKLALAFMHFAIIVPWWYTIAIIMIGGHFSQSIAAASTLVVISFVYPKRDKIFLGLMIYNILLFVLPSLYVNLYGPVIGIDFPFDEIIVFLICCGWVSIAFVAFDRSRTNLITNLRTKNEALLMRTNELHQFSYLMAHDIKTPIRNIVSFLGLLKRSLESSDIEKAKAHLDYALKGSTDLSKLVADVSTVIELRGDDAESDEALHDLNRIMEETLFAMKEEIVQFNGEVNYEDLGRYNCNSSDMNLLFQNLIVNGLKYNKSEKPEVNIYSKLTNTAKVLSFVDNGIGIEKKYQDKIFEFFHRLHVKSEYEGTGIGLGICNYIAGKYNGAIRVESREGSGSTFIVELPR